MRQEDRLSGDLKMQASENIDSTVFGTIFRLILMGNRDLIQEQDVFHNPIKYSYKLANERSR